MWQEAELIQAIFAKWPADEDFTAVLDLSARECSVPDCSHGELEPGDYSRNLLGLANALRNRLNERDQSGDDESSIRMLVRDTDPLFRVRRHSAQNEESPVEADPSPALDDALFEEAKSDEALLNRTLRRVDFFCDLSPELREEIVKKLVVAPFAAGEFLLRQGDRADGLLVLLEGTARVVVAEHERIHNIARLDSRTVIGEMSLVTKAKRTASVVAETPGWGATLSRADFESLAAGNISLMVSLSELIAQRLGRVAVDALCGKVVDRYEVRERLGRGGMAVVYLAVDREENRRVALKMLPHDQALDLLSSRRFRREAEIVGEFSHPNIVKVFREFTAFGTTFIAMEWCDGPALSEVIKLAGPLPREIVRKLVGQIAAALLETHAAGIAHRDLKPSNVLLTTAGDAKLADFGLARSVVKCDIGLTQVGEMMGTPRYMAPEQIDGERGDQRSDLFSLGCMAYELSTGKPVFQAAMWRELLREQANWVLPPREAIIPVLDEAVYALLSSTLRADPQDRCVDLAEIASWAAPVDWSAISSVTNLFARDVCSE